MSYSLEIERLRAACKSALNALETLGEDGWSEAPYLIRVLHAALEQKVAPEGECPDCGGPMATD